MDQITLETQLTADASHRLFRTRERRMPVLLLAVVILSAADLIMTLGFMQSVGMFEDNPLVHLILRFAGSSRVGAIVGFKTATVAFTIAVLYRLRRHGQGEIGTWLAVIILSTVCVQWVRYADVVLDLDHRDLLSLAQAEPGWVRFH